jgi:bacterioferritin
MGDSSRKDKNRGQFVSDLEAIRKRARQHIKNGAVTESYLADRKTVVRVLNDALATELVCVLRYKGHHDMASGIHFEKQFEKKKAKRHDSPEFLTP